MLSIIGQKKCERIEVELDDYVPLKIRCENESPLPHLYWRTGDFESTLLKVEINPVDGQLIGASLLLTGEVGSGFPALGTPLESLGGIPVARIHEWPEDRFVDEPQQLRVFVEGSSLLVLLGDGAAATSMSVRNVKFGVGADESLVWILINGLSSERLAALA